MKYVLFVLVALLSVLFFTAPAEHISRNTDEAVADSASIQFETHIEKAIAFTRRRAGYNKQVAFLVDMRRPSGKYRFFVVDLATRKIRDRGLVAHGANSEKDASGVMRFSNQPDSYCSSLGMYAIGAGYPGRFGRAYKLHGLDTSNNNAFRRFVVLHSYECVPDIEQEEPICNSLGCPMVSPAFLGKLSKIIDTSRTKIAMEIYY